MKTKTLFYAILAFSLLINACSKEEAKPVVDSNLLCSIASTVSGQYNFSRTTKLTYDEDNNLIKEVVLKEDGGVLITTTYEYENGKKIKKTKIGGGLPQTTNYEYDSNGNLSAETTTSSNIGCIRISYEYSNSLLINEAHFPCEAEEAIFYAIEHEYDSQGNKNKETHFQMNGDGSLKLSHGFVYEYDNGRLSKRHVFYTIGVIEPFEDEYTYDQDGKLLKDADNVTYTYDEFNRLKTESIPGGDIFEVKTYEYCD
jgi:major membrane immunogen (membrane-anchored lipoprotein)